MGDSFPRRRHHNEEIEDAAKAWNTRVDRSVIAPIPIVQPIVGKCRVCGQDTIRASGDGYECGEHTQPVR
ncbi:MAG: hypothetical protein K940chlam7_00554 [Chlamydiae bacterium]|nr:hypothetical protein [Chlamydiota bacterium]